MEMVTVLSVASSNSDAFFDPTLGGSDQPNLHISSRRGSRPHSMQLGAPGVSSVAGAGDAMPEEVFVLCRDAISVHIGSSEWH